MPAPAAAREWLVSPGGANGSVERIQEALDEAQPGDVITVNPGTYRESLHTVRDGTSTAPITLRAAGGRGTVEVLAAGRVLTVRHSHFVVDGLVLDGEYGADDLVRVTDTGSFLTLRRSELRRSSRDLVDLGAPRGVTIDGCLLHHALNPVGGRSDAHGVVGGAVQDLLIRDTEIHTFSGDGVQVDPGRAVPSWNNVIIEGSRIWLAPLAAAVNGFAAGVVPGENAVDTKASPRGARGTITIRNTTVWGFANGRIDDNLAAFNLKEHVEALVDGVTVHSSQIAFRLRGPADRGAWVTVKNAVIYDVMTAFRYEEDIDKLRIWHVTLGSNVSRMFEAASSNSRGLDVRNLLAIGELPREAGDSSNQSAQARTFADASAHDYRLAPGSRAIDAGTSLADVATDRRGAPRPQGARSDVGAYEAERAAPVDRVRPAQR
jgi:hypothetical protein